MADPERKKVCVIGAGAAGLCAARHLAANTKFEVTVYEQTNEIGGTWVYKDQVGFDEDGLPIHSSMYKNLRTNLPAQIMNFPDYAVMVAQEPSCVGHRDILNYLKDYAKRFDICQYIHFGTKVEHVQVGNLNDQEVWSVRVKKLKTGEMKFGFFDAIMVCNGHFFEPNIPRISGIETFPGTILHSHSYRKPDMFCGKTVVVLGAASSGIDIAIELSGYLDTHVYLSFDYDKLSSLLPSKVTQVSAVASIHESTFYLRDENIIENVDVFIFCTGYKYSFPFLDENCGIRVDNNYVSPLYKHLVNIDHPTMCIVGIPSVVLPFPMFHIQVQYFLALLEDRTLLPARSVMLEDSAYKCCRKKDAHKLMNNQWEYNDSLATAAEFDGLPLYYKLGYNEWSHQRGRDLLHYKDFRFVISEDGQSVEVTEPTS